ncbi:trimeric intracellular cation channel family protein [Pseudooceanicola nanhaiensis]|uniref:trimeric intracellular cation channel family protein n=1 Tax=Pseudooceanicola nanhaiensis TaxID=375761 RepID=UPI001CD3C08B|nr:trimeric intracellular cation channel family protein [Pseudooceanicola nanhaiensis]MCA0922651.1 trimeric intracellular cation channel family protein [Pseudooceanicola nanhaiensis]
MSSIPVGLSLDLLGTFVFGLSGAMLAVRRQLDLFGIAVLAICTALAGGMVRDLMLGATPPAALHDTRYLYTALASAVVVFFGHRLIEKMHRPVMVLDALGLGLFAVASCRKALLYGLDPLSAMLLGVVAAVGGGALRDILVTEVPRVLREDIYALAALLGAGVVVVGRALDLPDFWTSVAGVLLCALFRIVSHWRGWQVPRAPGSS